MKATKDVTAKVIDNAGMFIELARRLARDYKKVYYYVNNDDSAPMPQPSYVGHGYDEIEVVQSLYGDEFDYDCDLIIFASVGMGDVQLQMEEAGKAVWGSRMAQELELDREATKELFKAEGIPVGPYKEIVGIDALRQYLKNNENVFVKVSKWRGLIETFCSKSYASSELLLDIMAMKLGPIKNLIPFVVEKMLDDKVEIGQDLYTVDGAYPKLVSNGLEIKDRGYVTKMQRYEDTPQPLRDVNAKLAPIFKRYGMRGSFCTEMRVGKDKVAYPIDLTMRQGSPPGELLQEMFTNLADIIWQGANGILIDPKPIAKYGVQINIISDDLNHREPQAITFPKKYDRNVKLHSCCKIGDTHYVMPLDYEGDEGAGAVVGWGSSIEDAAKMVEEVAETVEGRSLTIDVKGIVEAAEEELEKANKMGLRMM
jgi:hypothetical protein